MPKIFPTQPSTILTNGVRLHAETAGPADGPLVLLLHGFPEYWMGLANQIQALAAAGMFVVAVDQRGYNTSQKPRPVRAYDVETLADDAAGILDHFGRAAGAVVGHDWGGVVAWQIAIQHPDRVSRLVVLNAPHPAAFQQELFALGSRQILRSWYIYFFQIPFVPEFLLRAANCRGLVNLLRASSAPETFSTEDLQGYQQAWKQPGAIRSMLHWYRAAVRRTLRLGPARYATASQVRVTMPTLILWGEKDVALSSELADASLRWCDAGRLVRFPNASHWVQHEEPARVSEELLTFLAVPPAR